MYNSLHAGLHVQPCSTWACTHFLMLTIQAGHKQYMASGDEDKDLFKTKCKATVKNDCTDTHHHIYSTYQKVVFFTSHSSAVGPACSLNVDKAKEQHQAHPILTWTEPITPNKCHLWDQNTSCRLLLCWKLTLPASKIIYQSHRHQPQSHHTLSKYNSKRHWATPKSTLPSLWRYRTLNVSCFCHSSTEQTPSHTHCCELGYWKGHEYLYYIYSTSYLYVLSVSALRVCPHPPTEPLTNHQVRFYHQVIWWQCVRADRVLIKCNVM